jgi:Mg-chelatase subunit ChlD
MSEEKDKIDQLTKWRMILGGQEADGTKVVLPQDLQQIDEALGALYEFELSGKFSYGGGDRTAGSGSSQPNVSRWLGDIRNYFPKSVVEVMQNDAMKFPALKEKMIFEPDILEKATPDVHLAATLLELKKLIPEKTKETARKVVQKVVDELLKKLEQKIISAIQGALDRSQRIHNPRHSEINWHATILKNLKHYQKDFKTVIPETLIGYGRKSKKSLKDVVLCLDQSGSMGESVVYSGIFGSVLASIPNVKTTMVVFDTEVADLTEDLEDPIDLLFGVQLGGGTDIAKALQYCTQVIQKPNDTIMILITDLYEGGDVKKMHEKAAELVASGVNLICLLALDDNGKPSYDKENAKKFSEIGIPVFGCTPDRFPNLMAAAIRKVDIHKWAAEEGIVLA